MRKEKFIALALAAGMALASGSALAAGDAAKGKKIFNKCKACHSIKAGKNKVGPSLAGVVGRKAGTAAGFKRYKGLKGADWTWDEALLDEYLTDPKKFAKARTGKKTSMVFKLKKAGQRADIIAYLKTLN
ncbi:MAG: c-type cytochrome [Proteobacteria bacterium]|nr:c-type cytochrome [Pseudomonadota bacterium]